MVISHSNNFIFLRVPKNASSSLAEYFIRNFCDIKDCYTAVNDCGIQNKNVQQSIIAKYRHQSHYIHMTLQELIDNNLVTKSKAQSMKKIIVLRNPLHRQLSLYFFLSRIKRIKPSPSDFRNKFRLGKHESDSNNAFTQLDYVKIDGKVANNCVFWKYEEIDERLKEFSNGKKIAHPIKRHKADRRPQKSMDELVAEYYDDETKAAVLEYYKDDLIEYNNIKSQQIIENKPTMKPEKAFILMMKGNSISESYAKTCADSCDSVGMPWEYIEWYDGNKGGSGIAMKAWAEVPAPVKNRDQFKPKRETAQCATSGHAMAWCKVRDFGKPAIIFEHDAILLHNININIPDNMIVVLGYKMENLNQYDHKTAGPPKEIVDTHGGGHEGAHAYAITPETAKKLLKELEDNGILGAIDNTHFLRSRKTKVPLKIMSPTPAIGWLRQSTIWRKSATKNYQFIDSFLQHYSGNEHKPVNRRNTKPPQTQQIHQKENAVSQVKVINPQNEAPDVYKKPPKKDISQRHNQKPRGYFARKGLR